MASGFDLNSGEFDSRALSEEELWEILSKIFSNQSNESSSYKFGLLKGILDNLTNVDSDMSLSFDDIFTKFVEAYWTKILKYNISQASITSDDYVSQIEKIIFDASKEYSISTETPYQSIPIEIRSIITERVKKQCKCNVIGAFFVDTERVFYSFSKRDEYIHFNPIIFDFLQRYKDTIEKINSYEWAKYLEKINYGNEFTSKFNSDADKENQLNDTNITCVTSTPHNIGKTSSKGDDVKPKFSDQVFNIVYKIPSGFVMSYGDIAKAIGNPNSAIAVGQALSKYPEDLPWWRVVKSNGSIHPGTYSKLKEDGVIFSSYNKVNMKMCRWADNNLIVTEPIMQEITEDNDSLENGICEALETEPIEQEITEDNDSLENDICEALETEPIEQEITEDNDSVHDDTRVMIENSIKEENDNDISEFEYTTFIDIDLPDSGEINTTLDQEGEKDPELIKEIADEFIRSCRVRGIKLGTFNRENAVIGSKIIRFEFTLERGEKIVTLQRQLEDIGRDIQRTGVLVQTVTNSSSLYLDVPRLHPEPVLFGSVYKSLPRINTPEKLPFTLGQTPDGKDLIVDLADCPHLLVGGSTGSGKTVFLWTLLSSLILTHPKPSDLQLVVASSGLEDFVYFNGLPHLIGGKVFADASEASEMITSIVYTEFERRKTLLAEAGCQNIQAYNKHHSKKLAPLVVLIDEFADLSDQLPKKIDKEELLYLPIRQIAQIGRKRGIHLVLCTQRPSGDLLPTNIRSLMGAKVALRVNDRASSSMILDETGAEELQKHGDMLFKEDAKTQRAQGYYIGTEDVEMIVNAVKEGALPNNDFSGSDAKNASPSSTLNIDVCDTENTYPDIINVDLPQARDEHLEKVRKAFEGEKKFYSQAEKDKFIKSVTSVIDRYIDTQQKARELLAKRFPPPQFTYDKYIAELENWLTVLIQKKEAALSIIDVALHGSEKVEGELTKLAGHVNEIGEKMQDFVIELTASLGNMNDAGHTNEIEELMEEMNSIIDSIKQYE